MSQGRGPAGSLQIAGIITLTTDFGTRDANVAVMKAVILGINPLVRLVDISHGIEAQNIAQGSYLLQRAHSHFPPGTIHVAVVDPGVGSDRRAILLETSHAYYLAPDNGLLTSVLREAERDRDPFRAFSLTNPEYWLPRVSNVFHGRDIFAPVAAHLSLGVPAESFGEEAEGLITLSQPEIQVGPDRIVGHVAYVDRFGNLLTNIHGLDLLPLGDELEVVVGDRVISGLSRTYSEAQDGTVVAYIDSSTHLAVAEVRGDAAETLGAGEGDVVEVRTAAAEDREASP